MREQLMTCLFAAEGKVFTMETDKQELSKWKKELLITSMHTGEECIYPFHF